MHEFKQVIKYYLLLIIFNIFINQIYGITNLKEFITLNDLEKLETVEIKKVLYEDDGTFQWVLNLPDGTVINEGGILTKKGYILKDTQTAWNHQDQHGLTRKNRDLNSENPMHFDGRLAVISSPGSENWYHWLLQVIARLVVLKESEIEFDRIYVNNLYQKWQIDSLDAVLHYLNIPKYKLLIINGDAIVQASHLIVPSVPFIPSMDSKLPKFIKDKLRDIFLNSKHAHSQIEINDKIYISRANASQRRIINEKNLTDALQVLGFKTIHLEALSPYDQAKLFNNAKVIIGPHGSGFANLIFASKGCRLIEIDHGINPSRSYYERMAALMDCSYYPFYVDSTTEEHLEDDMIIDIQRLLQFISHDEIVLGNGESLQCGN